MLSLHEQDRIAEQFGVDRAQVIRDHLISPVLAALTTEVPDAVLFFGGTDTFAHRGDVTATLRSSTARTVRPCASNFSSAVGYPHWPTMRVDLSQRCSDAPPATLTVLTPAGFVAAKTTAWCDRAAPRDLWDLWALAEHGHFTADAADLFARIGPTNRWPDPAAFTRPPDGSVWQRDLAAQVRLTVTAAEACATVQGRWAELARSI